MSDMASTYLLFRANPSYDHVNSGRVVRISDKTTVVLL